MVRAILLMTASIIRAAGVRAFSSVGASGPLQTWLVCVGENAGVVQWKISKHID